MQLQFVLSESTESYFAALEGYLTTHGCPVAFYSDKHTVYRIAKADAIGGQGMTQFGRALAELNIEILCANSSQAKGRVERANRTLQDRLVKELQLEGIVTIAAANAHLPGLIERFNERFARAPARPGDLRRPLKVTLSWLVTFYVVARFMQEALEMRYMWQVSLRLDNTKLRALLSEETHTALDQAIRDTLAALGRVSAATVGQAETEFRGTAGHSLTGPVPVRSHAH